MDCKTLHTEREAETLVRQLLDLKAPAKVNLTLDITGKLDNGYHTLESIFYEVPIYDTLALTITDVPNVDVQCITRSRNENIPSGEDNITYKTAKAFLSAIGDTTHGVSIGILKSIPSQAGLGGGSSDSACVLKALNRAFDYPLNDVELLHLSASLGADVPFFVLGGTAYATGIGDILQPLRPLPKLNMVIVKGLEGVSTPLAYRHLDELSTLQHLDNVSALQCVERQDIVGLCRYCGNVFEQTPLPNEVFELKDAMLQRGALCSMMSGSGSAVFGIFETPQLAKSCFETINAPMKFLV
jgi:4-diphosphocytidyl-2-C-methyl-D-erythritol kinase